MRESPCASRKYYQTIHEKVETLRLADRIVVNDPLVRDYLQKLSALLGKWPKD